MTVKIIENLQSPAPISEEELLEAEAAEYLQYLNERDERVRLACEKYPEEYAEYKRRELELAKHIIASEATENKRF